jgi:hypothetical protein
LAETRHSCPRRTTFQHCAANALGRISLYAGRTTFLRFAGMSVERDVVCPVRAGLRFNVSQRRRWGGRKETGPDIPGSILVLGNTFEL